MPLARALSLGMDIRSTGCLGVDAGAEEGFVGIDVADAGDGALVKQGGLDGHLAAAEGVAEDAPVECVAKGFRSEVANDAGQVGFVQRPGAAEAADVDEVEGGVAVELQDQAGVRLNCIGRAEMDAAAHHQVQDQDSVAQTQQEVLAATVDSLDSLANESEFELLERQAKGEFGVQDCRAPDVSSYDVGDQLAADRFNFRQLRHNRETMGLAHVSRPTACRSKPTRQAPRPIASRPPNPAGGDPRL